MTLAGLDAKPALTVIDPQKGVLHAPAAYAIEDIVERAATLASVFRHCQVPSPAAISPGSPRRPHR
jgi:nicotinamidase-related amidase